MKILTQSARKKNEKFLAHWELSGKRHIWGSACEQAVAFQVEINAREKVLPVENAIAASFQYLELVVETFHEAAVLASHKIIGDLFPPIIQSIQEVIEALQLTSLYPFDPSTDLFLGIRFGKRLFKDIGQPKNWYAV